MPRVADELSSPSGSVSLFVSLSLGLACFVCRARPAIVLLVVARPCTGSKAQAIPARRRGDEGRKERKARREHPEVFRG